MHLSRVWLGTTSLLISFTALAVTGTPPGEPSTWACASTTAPASAAQVNDWCQNYFNPPKGQPVRAPEFTAQPQPLSAIDAKNAYDFALNDWLQTKAYETWAHDKNWRLTGPAMGALTPAGQFADGTQQFGTHPAVRVFYSPKTVQWLCGKPDKNGNYTQPRQGEIADGAMIIKTQISESKLPKVRVSDLGESEHNCLSIPTTGKDAPVFANDNFSVIVRDSSVSRDGWYWWAGPNGVYTRSGSKDSTFGVGADGSGPPPASPNPAWYPTKSSSRYTNASTTGPDAGKTYTVISSSVFPTNLFGAACMNCHGSAQSQNTFASLDNVIGSGIQYKLFPNPKGLHSMGPAVSEVDHMDHAPAVSKLAATPDGTAANADRPPPLSTPLSAPSDAFKAFYKQIEPVDFAQAWTSRLPGQTYDHVVAGPDGPRGQFLTSDQCQNCHSATISNSATPNMVFPDKDGTQVNLSPYATWRYSPMGLAGRDPVFFAQLQSETNNLPADKACIENTCLHCHGVMGQRQHAIDTQTAAKGQCEDMFAVAPPEGVPSGKPFPLSMTQAYPGGEQPAGHVEYGALARDGISCTVCHTMAPSPMQTQPEATPTQTGNFVSGPADQVIGPYEKVITKPMQHIVGMTPKHDAFVKDSAMCNSCHDILLPVLTNQGERLGASYEQTTGLEWQNSDFSYGRKSFQSCQDCHLPKRFQGNALKARIANIQSADAFAPTTDALPDKDITLKERDDFARHTLAGLNVFLNEIFQQFPVLLGIEQEDYMNGNTKLPLTHARDVFIDIAQQATATLAVSPLQAKDKDDGATVSSTVTVTNLAGHYLPSGVGFRRLLLEYRMVDAEGQTLWCSGCTNELGVVVDGNGVPLKSEQPVAHPQSFQPHYLTITEQDQAQIYQELIMDSDGEFTTSFLRRIDHVKDNRIRPRGYDPAFFANSDSPYVQALAETHGAAQYDPYYIDPSKTGADTIDYQVTLDEATLARLDHVEVRLFSQSIPPFYLQQRFRDANRGPKAQDQIQRLWYATSHLNTAAKTTSGNAFIKDWKFEVGRCAGRSLSGNAVSCAAGG